MTASPTGTTSIEFLKRRAAECLATAKRFYEAAGPALDAAMEAALNDLPRLYIPATLTEDFLEDVLRLGGWFLASAKDANEAIREAHLEADIAFRAEMALDREERKRRGR